jgi:hypothetical protein
VKRLIALAVGVFGLRAYLRRRRRASEPADELREKLAAQRATADQAPPATVEEAAAVADPPTVTDEAPPPTPAEPAGDVDARRAEVHARARQKIDELSG